MTMSPRALATARRNLAQRIDRFIDSLEREGRDPNRLEADFALSALGHLAVDQWPMGEDAMMRAERAANATPAEVANARGGHKPVTAKHLRAELEKILQNKG
jgi:hypothetical protein